MKAKVIDMQQQTAQNVSNSEAVSQSFVTPFSQDPERWWESEAYAEEISKTMISQICASLAEQFGGNWQSVLASWGCVCGPGRLTGKVLRWRDMPALALHVNGYQHQGWVIISLDEGRDTYELELADEQFFAKPDSRRESVYFDELGERIDVMVETGDDEQAYQEQVAADPENAEVLSWRERFPNLRQVVYL